MKYRFQDSCAQRALGVNQSNIAQRKWLGLLILNFLQRVLTRDIASKPHLIRWYLTPFVLPITIMLVALSSPSYSEETFPCKINGNDAKCTVGLREYDWSFSFSGISDSTCPSAGEYAGSCTSESELMDHRLTGINITLGYSHCAAGLLGVTEWGRQNYIPQGGSSYLIEQMKAVTWVILNKLELTPLHGHLIVLAEGVQVEQTP